jgi:hypothetical protein
MEPGMFREIAIFGSRGPWFIIGVLAFLFAVIFFGMGWGLARI